MLIYCMLSLFLVIYKYMNFINVCIHMYINTCIRISIYRNIYIYLYVCMYNVYVWLYFFFLLDNFLMCNLPSFTQDIYPKPQIFSKPLKHASCLVCLWGGGGVPVPPHPTLLLYIYHAPWHTLSYSDGRGQRLYCTVM